MVTYKERVELLGRDIDEHKVQLEECGRVEKEHRMQLNTLEG